MTQNLDAILSFAKQIVDAGPKLPELESLDNRLVEVRKQVTQAESNYRLLEQQMISKTKELANIDVKLRDQTQAILDKAHERADAVLNEATRKAKEIVTLAQSQISDTTKEANARAAELEKLKQQIIDAQNNYNSIRQLARKIA